MADRVGLGRDIGLVVGWLRRMLLRILEIVVNAPTTGTYWRAFHFGRVLATRGHSVTLLAKVPRPSLNGRTYTLEGVDVVETPDLLPHKFRAGYDLWGSIYRMWWVRQRRFDLVHAFESRPTVLFPALVAQRQGARLVMDWCDWFGRGGMADECPNVFGRAVYRVVETFFEDTFRTRADGTTVINTFLRDRAIGLGVPPASILMVRNGSSTNLPRLTRAAARQALALPPDALLIGHAGAAIVGDAGFMGQAFNHILRRRPEAKLALLSYFKHPIEAWVENPKAVVRLSHPGLEQIHTGLAACDVCWLPLSDTGANRGRLPLKLNVYMAAGRPVVTTSVGDAASLVNEYHFGIATQPDPKVFAEKTLELLSDPEKCETLGQAARVAAEQALSWERAGMDVDQFYQDVMTHSLRIELAEGQS